MSLNFPTAFWKTQGVSAEDPVPNLLISWVTNLAWSKAGGIAYDDENINDIQTQSTFPFNVEKNGMVYEYYTSYANTYVSDEAPLPYYGWYLDGGPDDANPAPGKNDLSDYHRANPWIPYLSGISLWNEADYETAVSSGVEGSDEVLKSIYNNFVQSGSAIGTFNVSAAQASQGMSLYSTVSGLGEDFMIEQPYNIMALYLDSTKIADGVAPQDGRDITNMGAASNYDQQQVRLYAGSDPDHDTLLNPSSIAWLHIVVDSNDITNTSDDHNDNTYVDVSLDNETPGGSGTGIEATVVVYGGEVESVTITNVGSGYEEGDTLSIPKGTTGGDTNSTCTIKILGAPRTGFTITVPDANYIHNTTSDHNDGSYTNVALTGGSGSGIEATVVVSGDVVTSVVITDNGVGYEYWDELTIPKATTGGGVSSTCDIEVEGMVNELTRDFGYVTEDGTYTFKNAAISEGSHQIKIYTSTMDSMFSSGAFYGFKFELI